MNLKKWKIISGFLIFGLSALFHFIYTWFPNFFTSLLFPVNESIGEHNKIIIAAFLVVTLFEKFKFKEERNYLFSGIISAIICCVLVMSIFTPIYIYILNTKDNMLVTFLVFFISIAISNYINYRLLDIKYKEKLEKIAIVLWILAFIINATLTFYPPNIAIYYDFKAKIYGLK